MSFEEGRDEFIKKGINNKRIDNMARAALLLMPSIFVIDFPYVTFIVLIIGLILILHIACLFKQIFNKKILHSSILYIGIIIATLINFYLGMILMLIVYGKIARTYRKAANLSNNFLESQHDQRYFGIITGMIVCIILMLVHFFKILPHTIEYLR